MVKKNQTVSSNVAQHVCFIFVLMCNNSMAVKESFLRAKPFLFQSVYRGATPFCLFCSLFLHKCFAIIFCSVDILSQRLLSSDCQVTSLLSEKNLKGGAILALKWENCMGCLSWSMCIMSVMILFPLAAKRTGRRMDQSVISCS